MRRFLPLVLIATLLAGCGSGSKSGRGGSIPAGASEVRAELIENGRISKMCSLPPGFDCETRVGLEHRLDGGARVCLAPRDGYRR